jgi:TRAP-type C4-dicarboxylate transport system permease large subunit
MVTVAHRRSARGADVVRCLLFMMTKTAQGTLADLVREVKPFLVVVIGALAAVTLLLDLALFLPRLAGYSG